MNRRCFTQLIFGVIASTIYTNHRFIHIRYDPGGGVWFPPPHLVIDDNMFDSFVETNFQKDDIVIKDGRQIIFKIPACPIWEERKLAINQFKIEILEHISPGQYVCREVEENVESVLICTHADRIMT